MGGSTVGSRGGDDRDRGAAGFLGLTRVGGGSTRRAELARSEQREAAGGSGGWRERARPLLKTYSGRGLINHAQSLDHAPSGCAIVSARRSELGSVCGFQALAPRQKTGIPPLPAASRASESPTVSGCSYLPVPGLTEHSGPARSHRDPVSPHGGSCHPLLRKRHVLASGVQDSPVLDSLWSESQLLESTAFLS